MKAGQLDHIVVLLIFLGISIVFSIVAAPIYIRANCVGRFPFVYKEGHFLFPSHRCAG